MEFGTGTLVDIASDPGLRAYEATFIGKGIRQVNLPARPYFFPAVFKNFELLKQRLSKVI